MLSDDRPSVTDADWIDAIPRSGSALIVAEGLLPYLTPIEIRQLLTRLTYHFGSGEIVFDVLPTWAPKISKLVVWGTRGARELAQWNPRMRFVESIPALAHSALIPRPLQRSIFRLVNTIPAICNYVRLYRFEF